MNHNDGERGKQEKKIPGIQALMTERIQNIVSAEEMSLHFGLLLV